MPSRIWSASSSVLSTASTASSVESPASFAICDAVSSSDLRIELKVATAAVRPTFSATSERPYSRPIVRASSLKRSFFESEAIYRANRSEEHTSELQSRLHLVCRLLLEKKKKKQIK